MSASFLEEAMDTYVLCIFRFCKSLEINIRLVVGYYCYNFQSN